MFLSNLPWTGSSVDVQLLFLMKIGAREPVVPRLGLHPANHQRYAHHLQLLGGSRCLRHLLWRYFSGGTNSPIIFFVSIIVQYYYDDIDNEPQIDVDW